MLLFSLYGDCNNADHIVNDDNDNDINNSNNNSHNFTSHISIRRGYSGWLLKDHAWNY